MVKIISRYRDQKVCTVFIGPSGCGKGTHSGHIEMEHRVPRLEMGNLFRELKISTNDPSIIQRLSPMDDGHLVDDEFSIHRAKVWLLKNTANKRVLVDGAIRTRTQFKELSSFITARGYEIRVVWFNTNIKVCYERLLNKPRQGRTDDTVKPKILRRIHAYCSETRHLKPVLLNNGIQMLEIDNSNVSIELVRSRIENFFVTGMIQPS